jgi:hypothetical protein
MTYWLNLPPPSEDSEWLPIGLLRLCVAGRILPSLTRDAFRSSGASGLFTGGLAVTFKEPDQTGLGDEYRPPEFKEINRSL